MLTVSVAQQVDFGNLGAEELGSIYESLLELIPHYDPDDRSYTLTVLPGNERKESGSYYTPTSLVECLLDSALDPLLDEACAHNSSPERVAALLDLTVCDPACGSGHFLVAAARRIAKRIAAEETGEAEPPEPEVRRALRQVVGRCIYGVDVNPMAAELAKVSLWIEALEPGKPLSYLDQNIRVGNSLLGVTPALLADGLPDEAFKPIEGDDRKVCSALKKQNAAERQGQYDLFSQSGIPVTNSILAKRVDSITHTLPENLEDLHIHQQREAEQLAASKERRIQKLLADAWCAAFVQPKTDETRSTAITQAAIEDFAADRSSLDLGATEQLVADMTRQYRFFHWHVEFPHIFPIGNGTTSLDPRTGWSGGFSCVIGNPPWERVKLQEQEFFASRQPTIANASNAAVRKKMIQALRDTDVALYNEFQAELRGSAGWSHFLRGSGRYPLTGRGDVNTYAVFAETAHTIISSEGYSGLVLPTGIATDVTTAPFFGTLTRNYSLSLVYSFRNNRGLFKGVGHGDVRFCLISFSGISRKINESRFAFDLGLPSEISDPQRIYTLTQDEIILVNPNTGTCPAFNSPRDAKIIMSAYKRWPILLQRNPEVNQWNISFLRMFDATNDAHLFRTGGELEKDGWTLCGNIYKRSESARMLPLQEGKMIYNYDHRFADYRYRGKERVDSVLPRSSIEDKRDQNFFIAPQYWVDEKEVAKRASRRHFACTSVFLAHRRVTRNTDERSCVSALIPWGAVSNSLIINAGPEARQIIYLSAVYGSFAYDYVLRNSFSQASVPHSTSEQIPVPQPSKFLDTASWTGMLSLGDWVENRVFELTYTAYDLSELASDLGDDGPPFRWDEERRFMMRAELDAAFFHLYGIERDDVDYIMETFPIVKRKDVQQYGTYRTKDLVLQIYDAMSEATRTGAEYRTLLTPPPGQGHRHPSRS